MPVQGNSKRSAGRSNGLPLCRERRRSSFTDLADLQERLCLPASVVEALIGRVSFGDPVPACRSADAGSFLHRIAGLQQRA